MDDEGVILMEGWLYLIRSNTIGFKYSRKLYYVLQNCRFKSFRSISHSYNKDPIQSAVVDSNIRVTDDGRKCIRGKVFFVFTLSDASNHNVHVKLGASNPEEAAKWIKSFRELSPKVNQNTGNHLECPKSNYSSKVYDKNDVDGILSLASIMDPRTAAMCEPSYWTILGCRNGLRLFKQARYEEGHNKRDGRPALAAVSVIEETPEAVFHTLMSLGSSRSQWDFCFLKGSVIENIDNHTDIIHKQLDGDWLPWSMKRRDLLLQRQWKRDDNGTYVILYQSVFHKKCPHQKGFIRAFLKCGGYVISPGNQYKQSVVRHMLAIDWKSWKHNLRKSYERRLTIHMLETLAALREHFKINFADYLSPTFSLQEPKKDNMLHKTKDVSDGRIGDESDDFFDFEEPLFDDESEGSWATDNKSRIYSTDANAVAEKKHDFVCEFTFDTKSICTAAQKKGCPDSERIVWEECVSHNYTISLPEDQTGELPHSWSTSDASLFQIRGETFLEDHKKITAENTLLQTAAVDLLKSDKREDHLASRPGNIVQKYAADGRPEFFIVVNFQVPGSTNYNLAFYYTTRTHIKDVPLLERFIEGDDAFRNSRFKIIPQVAKGPWILRQAIRRQTLIGHMLKINYIRGENYLEVDIDVGSSACARGLAGKTFSCFNNLITDTAFVIQANTRDELPEHLLGTCRLSHLDVSKAVWVNQ
ncbi:putative pleckstrin domain, START domain, protein ENHANCED DISEASE RESISTANCE 2 [Helianthus annuus]|nr:putative pleckstrin domain, START domain, protein ENHANCED DISEASE RESISTANCE 2 [Helianthus annuus]